MALPNMLFRCARTDAPRTPSHGSVALIVLLMMALVFVPVVGLHVALAAFAGERAADSPRLSDKATAPFIVRPHG